MTDFSQRTQGLWYASNNYINTAEKQLGKMYEHGPKGRNIEEARANAAFVVYACTNIECITAERDMFRSALEEIDTIFKFPEITVVPDFALTIYDIVLKALSTKEKEPPMFNLVERLRKATSPRSFDHIGAMQITNPPICIEAANEIELLGAERDMLKAALKKIAAFHNIGVNYRIVATQSPSIAREALAKLTPQTQDIDPAAPNYDVRASHEVGK